MDMNEGTLTVLIQWCFLCLIWMGVYDRVLDRWGIRRAEALAVVTVFLICAFVSWKIAFLPSVRVHISGMILPFLCAGWLYAKQRQSRKRFMVILGGCLGVALFWFRWLLFTDPVLAIWDESWMLPVVAFLAVLTISRSGLTQLFLLLYSLTLGEVLYALFEWRFSGSCLIGGEYAQDLLWSTLSLWSLLAGGWLVLRQLLRIGQRDRDPENQG
ncbi:YphA family membrane protein [Brevibacillus ruminantium]